MNNNIVRETVPEIKILARTALKDCWLKVTVGFTLYYLLMTLVPGILSSIFPGINYPMEIDGSTLNYEFSYVNILYGALISGALVLGLAVFFLSFLRKRDINFSYVLSGFEYYFKAIGLFIVVSIFTALWSMLFLIPGIIAMYKYSMAFYILADNPEKGIMQCINESKEMMMGNKGKLFSLEISFIGWAILATIPAALYSSAFAQSPALGLGSANMGMTNPVLTMVIMFLLLIPMYFVISYAYTARTLFYEIASGHLVARRREEPPIM